LSPLADTATILDLLARLVAFDTTSRNSNLALVDWLEAYLAPLGFALERFPDATATKASLYATIGPADRPGVILSGHTDVVPVDGQAWSSDPFVLRRENGRVYGRGACDMKGFLAVCLAAAPAMAARPLAKPIHLAFSYDEEVGCVGVRDLVEALSQRAVKAEACFVGEPTGMQVVIGHKGKRSLKAMVRGRTCHSSLAPQGVNAVEWGARLVAEIRRVADELAERGARDELYDVPFSTAHVGVMRGGTALNIVPETCEILFEIRSIGADDPDALVRRIRAYAETVLEPAMRAVDPEAGFRFEPLSGFPGLDTPPEAEVVTVGKALAGRNDHAKVAFGTEAGLFDRVAGIPSVVIGPGSIAQAHTADEWIEVAELERCARFVERLVERCRV
jgi:acetylornithine deacetylase